MSTSNHFRSAFNGFNREDVVHYLQYLNTKHANQVNQLTAENDALRSKLEGLPELESQQLLISSLEEKVRELTRQLELSQERCAQLESQPEPPAAVQVQIPPQPTDTSEELEIYRRAERIEREARERAELVYFQANSVLTEATAKVDGISTDITDMADKVIAQLTQLQIAVSSSKQALQDAASIMSAIRPNK